MTDVEMITDTHREMRARIADLERQALLEESRRLEGTDEDTSPRAGDPMQPAEAVPVPEPEVALRAPLTADRIIGRALSREGYRETSKEVSEFGAWYGVNPGAWCAM